MKRLVTAVVTAASISFSMACGRQGSSESELQTFETANTPIKSQGQVGFCWAYAAVAMIESDYKRRTGVDLDLSEEAIGFFYFAEQIKEQIDWNLRQPVLRIPSITVEEGSQISPIPGINNATDAFSLIARWGLIPESQWSVKFDTDLAVKQARASIAGEINKTEESLRYERSAVTWENVFSILTKNAFPSLPPVDGFNNGSGQRDAVKYAREVIGFNPSNYESVLIDGSNAESRFQTTLQRIKEVIGRGGVVGIGVSMPDVLDPASASRIQGTKFIGKGAPFRIGGGHAMVITDFRNSTGSFGKSLNPMEEVAKPLEVSLVFRLKNSWGSQSGINEFGQLVQTGYYDMDLMYLSDVLQSGGYMTFTFPRL